MLPHAEVLRVALSPDGKRAVTASSGLARVWDVATGKLLHTLAFTGSPENARISPDGSRAYLSNSNKLILAYDLNSGKLLRELTGHNGAVHWFGIAANGRFLASGGSDGTIRVWAAK